MNQPIKLSLDTPQKAVEFFLEQIKKMSQKKPETFDQKLVRIFREKQPDSLVLESLEAEIDLIKQTLGWSENKILSMPCIYRARLVKDIMWLKDDFGWDGSRESFLAICRNYRDALLANN